MKKSLLATGLLMMVLGSVVTAEKANMCKLEIEVKEIRNTAGKIMLALYNKKHGNFPNNEKTAVKALVGSIKAKKSSVIIETDCASYVVAVYHDENGDGKLDKNMLEMPKEGYGFSNNPDAKYGPPEYEKAEFLLKKDRKIKISLVYLF